ncbi:hypothetical protein J6590_020319 [Homalodisca vitripennis]|nr:hypothetical protein J6590_020319 [Homalodisca vitripennis]
MSSPALPVGQGRAEQQFGSQPPASREYVHSADPRSLGRPTSHVQSNVKPLKGHVRVSIASRLPCISCVILLRLLSSRRLRLTGYEGLAGMHAPVRSYNSIISRVNLRGQLWKRAMTTCCEVTSLPNFTVMTRTFRCINVRTGRDSGRSIVKIGARPGRPIKAGKSEASERGRASQGGRESQTQGREGNRFSINRARLTASGPVPPIIRKLHSTSIHNTRFQRTEVCSSSSTRPS